MFDETKLQTEVNAIILRLYMPDGIITDESLAKCGVAPGEPINRKNLRCCGFSFAAETATWIIYIREAAPDICPTFCRFVELALLESGFFDDDDVRVITMF